MDKKQVCFHAFHCCGNSSEQGSLSKNELLSSALLVAVMHLLGSMDMDIVEKSLATLNQALVQQEKKFVQKVYRETEAGKS
jgi:hypothetical protein